MLLESGQDDEGNASVYAQLRPPLLLEGHLCLHSPRYVGFILTKSNTIIQRMKCVQFLGLHIDEKLDWHKHINKCKNKLTSALYIINNVNSYLLVSALKTIYYTLVYHYLTYGILLWGSSCKTYLTTLFIIQKSIVCCILKRNYWE